MKSKEKYIDLGYEKVKVPRDVYVEVGGSFGINVLAAEDPSNQSAPYASIRITITPGA